MAGTGAGAGPADSVGGAASPRVRLRLDGIRLKLTSTSSSGISSAAHLREGRLDAVRAECEPSHPRRGRALPPSQLRSHRLHSRSASCIVHISCADAGSAVHSSQFTHAATNESAPQPFLTGKGSRNDAQKPQQPSSAAGDRRVTGNQADGTILHLPAHRHAAIPRSGINPSRRSDSNLTVEFQSAHRSFLAIFVGLLVDADAHQTLPLPCHRPGELRA